jgi:predicted nuclease of restriction endonuclease-like (RecB) superfamily
MSKITNNSDFEQVLLLIQEARGRVYAKANAELILLYFNVGKVVSQKVEAGNWGENTVQELANFIASKHPELSGFNRRGLYRMKQFYETYSIQSECFLLWLSINGTIVTPVAAELQGIDNEEDIFVSAVPSQIESHNTFLNNLLLKLIWTNHLEILSTCKKAEEQLFYLMSAITEKWSMRELRRQIKTATFERTMLSKQQNKIVPQLVAKLPQNLFKDPYIFEFINLPEQHSEKDFEKAIIHNLQKFILEVGKGFAYMGNQ